jgi:deoxyribonuclease V
MPPIVRARRHPWPRDAKRAIRLQRSLHPRLRIGGSPAGVRLVAGADIAYDPRRDRLLAAILVFRLPGLELVETSQVARKVRFPYVPGLLSFREAPPLLEAWDRLAAKPELLICDGQGIAHPRRLGLASHLGLLIGVPTIGCAKSRLVGVHDEVGSQRGDRTPLRHEGRILGAVVRTRSRVRPLYVSPGHLIGIPAATRWVLRLCRGYRLPEPTRLADQFVGHALRGGR